MRPIFDQLLTTICLECVHSLKSVSEYSKICYFFLTKNPKFSAQGAQPSGQILHVKLEVSAGEIALTVGTVAV